MKEGKLVFLPKGYRVVPESALRNLTYSFDGRNRMEALLAAPPINTPTVFRWEGDVLMVLDHPLAYINHLSCGGVIWHLNTPTPQHMGNAMDSILARRAAEKALGFPEWLVVDEV